MALCRDEMNDSIGLTLAGRGLGKLLNLIVELVEDPVVHGSLVSGVERSNVSGLLLLEP